MMRAGQLFEITDGNRQAVVTEQGAALFRVCWDGAELLNGITDDGFGAFDGHGQLLVPWPGRIRGGKYEYEGHRYELPINDHVTGASIHGWARWATWQPKDHNPDRITLNCRLLAMPGYPFPFEYEQSYAWQGEGLDISLIAKNIGDRTAPFGYGAHPYLAVGHRLIDETTLQVQANRYFEVDEHLTPIEPASSVDGTPFDFRQPRPIGATKLDVTLAELARDDEGRIVVNYRSADSSISITCRYYEPIKFIQLFSGDTLPMYRRRSLAIEPYTCLPNAFNNGIGLIHIPPGGAVRVHWTLGA